MIRLAVTLATLACLAATPAAFAQSEEDVFFAIENMHGDAEGFFEAFSAVQDAIMLDMPESLTAQVAYPITIEANGEVYDVLAEQDLLDNFDALISPETQQAIGTQDVGDLLVNSDGVAIGAGNVWFTNICLDDGCGQTQWVVFAINN